MTVIPTKLTYDTKQGDWDMKKRFASGKVRKGGDY